MELRVLRHRLAATDDLGVPVEISRGQVRGLLCVLAFESNAVVSNTTLIDLLWEEEGGDPARSLKQAVYNARQLLGKDRIRTEGGGYRLDLGEDDYLDLVEFRELTGRARSARDVDPRAAAALYRRALDLWGEPPAGDLQQTIGMKPLRQSLLGGLLDAREEFAEALLELHEFRQVIDSATRWLVDDAYNEHLRGLLMLALSRTGRKGQALRTYRDAIDLLGPHDKPGSWLESIGNQIAENRHNGDWSPRPVWLASEEHRVEGTGIEIALPSPARVYDALLGGKDNFAVDREAAAKMVEEYSDARQVARLNRAFVTRAVRYLAEEAGISQYIDIGTGLPAVENVHEIAQRTRPDARVLYVDNDPMVCAYGRALLRTNKQVDIIQAEVQNPQGILEHSATRRLIDFTQPVAILLAAVLHFVPDEDDPPAIVNTYARALPPGGYLVISHSTPPSNAVPDLHTPGGPWGRGGINPRDRATIARFFNGLTLVGPGHLVDAPDWRPDLADTKIEPGLDTWWVGVARKDPALSED